MKTLKEVIDNYKDYRVGFVDLFGYDLLEFLDNAQKFKINLDCENITNSTKWTENNILKKLKQKVINGYEISFTKKDTKCALIYMATISWCKVLENEFANWNVKDFANNKTQLFKDIASKYNWKLPKINKKEV